MSDTTNANPAPDGKAPPSIAPAPAPAPATAQAGAITDRLAAVEAQVAAAPSQDAFATLLSDLNSRMDALVARIQPLEAAVGAPDVAGDLETRIKSVEGRVSGFIASHVPVINSIIGVLRSNFPHDDIPDPNKPPVPVVVAPIIQHGLRRLS